MSFPTPTAFFHQPPIFLKNRREERGERKENGRYEMIVRGWQLLQL